MNNIKLFKTIISLQLILVFRLSGFPPYDLDAKHKKQANLNYTIAGFYSEYYLDSVLVKSNQLEQNYNQFNFLKNVREKLQESGQILIVTSQKWDSATADLIYYERNNGKLKKVSGNISVNLGRSGMGWGKGVLDFNNIDGPLKHEGDGRSPAGIFSLSYAFGYLPEDSLSRLNYPYRQLTKDIECVDDTTSEYYNRLVNSSEVKKTWNSSEIMKSTGIHYKYGIIVEHNSNPPIPGCGSCIFIHVGTKSGEPTAGCTSLSEDQILKLLHWLDFKKRPVLIQLPASEFEKIKEAINLQED